jgi:hypothetical protein
VAFRSGDLPTALSCLDEAGRRYRDLAVPMPDIAIDRCAVLLAAGLPGDAVAETDAAVRGYGRGGRATKRAELLLSAATAALAAGEPGLAAERARAAWRMFAAQGRPWWRAHAGLLLLQARSAAGPPSARLLRQGAQVADDLALLGSSEAAPARLLAGRLAAALGRPAEADAHLTAAARNRHRGVPALARARGWLAEALRAEAAAHGAELAALAQRSALAAARGGFCRAVPGPFAAGALSARSGARPRPMPHHTPAGRHVSKPGAASSVWVRATPTGGTGLALGGAWVPGEPGAPGSAERKPAGAGAPAVSPAIRRPGPAAESGGAAGPHLPRARGQRALAAGAGRPARCGHGLL